MTTVSGRLFFLTTLVALALLVVPAFASTAGTIVIYGNAFGTHLDLSEAGGRLVVEGHQGVQPPKGCSQNADRTRSVCRLAGADAIEVQMGPSDDFVEVDTALPRSLTVYLGGGSDKFIGNAENDSCYSGGARRNRCIGGPGNDICIMGPGQDGCHGEAGDDRLYGGPGADQLYGGAGNNYCEGLPGIGKSHECHVGSLH